MSGARSGKRLSILLFVVAACAPLLASQPADGGRLRSLHLVGDQDYAPLTYLDSGIAKGLDVDIAKAIADRLGVELRVELIEWNEAQRRVLEGRADGLLSMSITDERRRLFDFTERTLTRDFGLFVRHGGGVTPGTADVAHKRIGVTPGGYPRLFLTARGTRSLVLINNYDDGFNRLTAGTIDAVAADTWVGAHTVQRAGRRDIHLSGAPFAALSGAMAFRKNSAIVKEVDVAIRQMTADGTLAAIQDRWRPDEVRFFSERSLRRMATVGGGGLTAVAFCAAGAWMHGLRRQRRSRRQIQSAHLENQHHQSVRRELEAQLRQAQKMDAVGRLAAGIAHDFNNLMTVVLAGCDEALSTPGLPNEARESIEDVHTAAESAAALTGQLLAFSRRQIGQPRLVNLNEVVDDARRLIARVIKGPITLEVHQDRQLGNIVADVVQLQQVLLNLAVNARDAMPRGGRLVIETRNVSIDHQDVNRPPMPPGPYVLLAVSDTGIGMDEATRAHLFEPFFTTKAVGQGTGLGLSTVHGIVTQGGGVIRASSEVGVGSKFEIYLPRVE